ncbi:MAG: hypothetical protein P8I13_06770 [Porticoccaceae bacterium]|nr:hypothetical protein [Porticoccaceae bacterium]
MLRFIGCLLLITPATLADIYFFKGQEISLQKLDQDRYLNDKGNVVGISDSFFIKQDKELSVILDRYNLHLVKTYSNNLHKVQSKSKTDLLALIEKIDADPLTQYAYPNFIKKIQAR